MTKIAVGSFVLISISSWPNWNGIGVVTNIIHLRSKVSYHVKALSGLHAGTVGGFHRRSLSVIKASSEQLEMLKNLYVREV